MPFKSQKQRGLFYAKMNRGEFSPEMVKKWEEHTPKDKKLPKYVEKKAMANNFWSGFSKRAAENFVSANNTANHPGAPEKLLKWNDHGGVDPREPEEMQAAQAAQLVTLPPDVEGAKCGTCVHFRPITAEMGHGFCTNPMIKMDVTDHMHCINWSHPGVHDPAAAAEQEAQDQQFQQAMGAQQGMQPGMEGQPGMEAQQGVDGQPPVDNGQEQSQPPAGQGMTMQPQTSPEAQTTEGNNGKEYQPSEIGTQSGFPQGRQTSANPMVEQAVQDFQGSGAVGGGTGLDNEKPRTPESKKKEKKPAGGKGHTININVSGEKSEKTASQNFWKGIVEGY
jgi:hypothetical protein